MPCIASLTRTNQTGPSWQMQNSQDGGGEPATLRQVRGRQGKRDQSRYPKPPAPPVIGESIRTRYLILHRQLGLTHKQLPLFSRTHKSPRLPSTELHLCRISPASLFFPNCLSSAALCAHHFTPLPNKPSISAQRAQLPK